MQVLMPLHGALQAVALSDPLLRVSVGLRLALHLQAAATPAAAAAILSQVATTLVPAMAQCKCILGRHHIC